MKKLLFIGLLLSMTGCSKVYEIINNDTTQEPVVEEDTSEKTLVCRQEDGDSVTFIAKGDEVHQMKQVSHIAYDELGLDPNTMDKDVIQQQINQAITDKYQGLAGVGIIGQMAEDKIEITADINFDQADKQALIDARLLSQGEKDSQYISLKKTQEEYKNSYACEFE